MLYHDSHDEAYRVPVGALKTGDTVTLRFWCDEGIPTLRIWAGSERLIPMQPIGNDRWEASACMPDVPQLVWYCFRVERDDGISYYGNNAEQLGGVGCWSREVPAGYQLTVYDAAYETPAYLRNGVIYQIFPDRFCPDEVGSGLNERAERIRAAHPEATFHASWDEAPALDIDPESGDNRALDFFGGTLRGIISKLDELMAFGVTVLYLNPVFRARSNHRYDTGDYGEVDPILGTDADLDALFKAAAERGMHVLMDGVFSHTGADSRYFNRFGRYDGIGAYQSKESPYADWFTFDEWPDRYLCWWNFPTLPAVDKSQPAYRSYLLNGKDGILPGYVKRGACGWRLDVADELPMDLIREMRQALHAQDPNSVLLGEVWEDASNKVSYGKMRSYCLGDTLDSVMNYPLRRAVINFFTGVCDSEALRRVILHQREVYPAPFGYAAMNLLGSHDRVRILNAMAGYDTAGAIQMPREQAAAIRLSPDEKVLAVSRYVRAMQLICALPGAPTVYYGDEIGMTGMADPFCRAPMAWAHADAALRDTVASLLRNRAEHPILRSGYLKAEAPDADTLVITRYAVNGKDAFGQPTGEAPATVRISRR